ncbi:MAG: WGR domain-containing protein [Deltaproteobacteria bacterium]|nr:WGR domain-containing protein [Deltaproteobacteria bacterium]
MTQRRVRYFELREGDSAKFLEITLHGKDFTVCQGKVGLSGRQKTTSHGSGEQAKEAANKLMWRKHAQGYVHLSDEAWARAAARFWGGPRRDHLGFTSVKTFHVPAFGKTMAIGFGPEDDGEMELVEPTLAELGDFSASFEEFLYGHEEHYLTVCAKAFERYERIYARGYRDKSSLVTPMNAETHARYLSLSRIHMQKATTIRLVFDYELDEEHGLEVVFKDNEFWGIGGISDVVW